MNLWIILLLLSLCGFTKSTKFLKTNSCILDSGGGTVAELEGCLRISDRFLNKYVKNMKRGKHGNCNDFADLQDCLEPLLERCPLYHDVLPPGWRFIYDLFHCACKKDSSQSEACQESIVCFEDQYGSLLGRRCDAYYKFNRKQETHHRCFFQEENIRCKESLVTSACGKDAGQFAFHISKLSLKNTDDCAFSISDQYEGFVFNEDCPADLEILISNCESEYLHKRSRLLFYEENDLVVDGNQKDINRACRDFTLFKECTAPLKKKCPEGYEMVLDFNGQLRTYALKLDYICNEEETAYSTSLSCYKDVLSNETLSVCYKYFEELQPILEMTTAFEFYCLPDHPSTLQIHGYLNDLQQCYGNVYTASCSTESSRDMLGLVEKAFLDPFYLRFRYKPDCELHQRVVERISPASMGIDGKNPSGRSVNAWVAPENSQICLMRSDLLISVSIIVYYLNK